MANENKTVPKAECPYCGEICKRHSINRNGKNVFVCLNKKCPKVKLSKNKEKIYFTENNLINISDQEADYLRAIVALLRYNPPDATNKYKKFNALTAIKRNLVCKKSLEGLNFEIKSLQPKDVNYLNTQYFKAKSIPCYKPKLVICQDGDKISIIRLPDHDFKEVSTADVYKSYQNIRLLNIPPSKVKLIKMTKKSIKRPQRSNIKPAYASSDYWRNHKFRSIERD